MEGKGTPNGQILRTGHIIAVIISVFAYIATDLKRFEGLDFCFTENTSCYNVWRKGI